MKDPYTQLGVRIKREHKPWLLILAWIVLIIVFFYAIGFIAEQFSDSVEWPLGGE